MANISLNALNEVIDARKNLHGGTVGAPITLVDGVRQGDALNRACVVLLSATLQGYVEEVFMECSEHAFGEYTEDEAKRYRNTWSRWGNPSPSNITNLFRRIGIDDVFDGLSWQGQGTEALKKNLDELNQVRNRIAHVVPIAVNGRPFALTLAKIIRWRNVSERFGVKFKDIAFSYYEEDD
jgi:hypothetical protein